MKKDQDVAQSLEAFWDWIIDKKIGRCSSYDEWCEAFLFNETKNIWSCVTKQNRSVLECIDIEKRKLKLHRID